MTYFRYILRFTVINYTFLETPSNGQQHFPDKSVEGAIASFTCDKGYKLEGSAERTCQGNGEWTGTDATCVSK